MIAITNKNKVTRYYNPETDYYAIYTDIVRCINPYTDFVNIDKKTHNIASGIACWCEMATYGEKYENNMEALKEFTKEYWVNTYENDEDEFIYQWINELHLYCAGYTSENVYKAFLDTIEGSLTIDNQQKDKEIDICE